MRTKIISKALSTLTLACMLAFTFFSADANAADAKTQPVNGVYVDYTYDQPESIITHPFTLTTSGTVTVNVQAQFIANVKLCNADTDKEYDSKYGIYGTPTAPKTETIKLDLEAGKYYISVSSSQLSDPSTGVYRIKISQTPSGSTEIEPNDNFAQAMNLPRETLITGFISWDNPNDFYKITLPANEKIALTMILNENAYGSTSKNVTIYNSDFEQQSVHAFYASTPGGSDTKEIELSKGISYIKIDHFGLYDYTGSYQIRWKKAPVYVTELSISGKKTVNVGKKITLKANVTPVAADNKTVTWTSSDPSIASVSSSGVVTGKKIGKVTITATSTDGTNINSNHFLYIGPKKVSNLKATAKGNKKVLIRWTKQKNISGIQVQYAKKKNFKNAKKKTVNTTAAKATVKLAKGTYYVKVRAFATIDGKKYYGDWSSAKKVKIK